MSDLHTLPNISKVNEEKLVQAGVKDIADLKSLGSKDAFLLIRDKVDEGACLSLLCGLEGAIQGIRWHSLDQDIKDDLKEFYDRVKKESTVKF